MAGERQRQRLLILDTLLLGVAGALGAQVFMYLLRLCQRFFMGYLAQYQAPTLPGEGSAQQVIGPHGLWLIPVATTLGGLIVGIMIDKIAPEAEGHGTDTAVRAFHRAEGYLRARVPPIKVIASAITIGSGGAAGREGPIALIAAGVGSVYATFTGRSEEDRRLLLLIGMAAGLSAIFRSPVGTALFAIEVLYSDMVFESNALIYTMLGSIVAYAINGLFVGYRPLFLVPTDIALSGSLGYFWYILLGFAAGLISLLLPVVFYGVRDWFRNLNIPNMLKPAVGGLGVGVLALWVPQILGGGYGWMQMAIDGRLALTTLLILAFAKILALSLSISSGGSGGVFAPSLFVGAMLGSFMAVLLHQPAAPFAVVGMAAVFAGAARVPIATLVMVTEMTGGYTLLVPAALAVMISYMVESRLSTRFKYNSLYEAQVPSRADSPAHHTEHLKIALRILKEQGVSNPSDVGQFDLLSLLRSGVPVELPGDRRLSIGVVREDGRFNGFPAGEHGGHLDEDTQIISIIRDEHMIAAGPNTVLQPGDRLILLTTPEGLERLEEHFDKW